ncbi:MAG TPA: hypothetical protein VHM27_02880, partial [Rhizomicrobium sp.]|nr:hypothetical protein [Rhizomicrobium sp.]
MTAPRFLKTISGQITGLIIFSVLLSLLLTFGVTYLFANSQRGQSFFTDNPRRPGEPFQAATIARLADAAPSRQSVRDIVAAAQRAGIDVQLLPRGSASSGAKIGDRPTFPGWREFGDRVYVTPGHALEIRLRSGQFLSFAMPPRAAFRSALPIPWPLLVPLLFILTMIAVALAGLSIYAARAIVSPLSSFSDAAHSMGRMAR